MKTHEKWESWTLCATKTKASTGEKRRHLCPWPVQMIAEGKTSYEPSWNVKVTTTKSKQSRQQNKASMQTFGNKTSAPVPRALFRVADAKARMARERCDYRCPRRACAMPTAGGQANQLSSWWYTFGTKFCFVHTYRERL